MTGAVDLKLMVRSTVLKATVFLILLLSPIVCFSKRLGPSPKYWEFWADIAGRPSTYRVALSKHRELVTIGDTLYLLKRNRILWTWVSDAPIWNAPVVDSQGTIYVVGYDMLWAAVDSATGKKKWHSTANGRAAYSQIKLYRKDMYLVVTDMWGYRDSLRDPNIKDSLSLCKGNALLWDIEIPAHTKLQILNDKVFVSYKRHGHLVRIRVPVPRNFGKPLGRISVLADYEGRQIIDEK